jgi:DNA-binding MarR family transcriptional regulator
MQKPSVPDHSQKESTQFYHLLISLYMHLMEGEDRLFGAEGIERNMFWALWHIGRSPQGTSMTALSRAIWSDKSTITHLVDRMEEAGLVQRSAHRQDRRVKTLILTPKGRVALSRLVDLHQQVIEHLLPSELLNRQDTALEQLAVLEKHMSGALGDKEALRLLSNSAPEDEVGSGGAGSLPARVP